MSLTRRAALAAAGAAAAIASNSRLGHAQTDPSMTTLIRNARITTLDPARPEAEALAVEDGRILAVGTEEDVRAAAGRIERVIDAGGRRVIPGLNDSHTHLIRGGLNYNMELRWENVPSLADALRLLREQAERTPAPQWVRVVGGWSEFQFAELRMPTLDEINTAAPDTPVFILHLYARAMLNRAALAVLGIDRDTPNPPGGVIEKDAAGNPTGMLIAKPSALILYSTLSRGPKLPADYARNSTRHYMREMNRLGITSVIDAGGGGQNYPDDYAIIQDLADAGELTVRIAYNLFAQTAGSELTDYERWVAMTEPGAGGPMLRMNGAGENLTWSAADFENFLEPRPELGPVMEAELETIVSLLAERRWPFRIHATYDESIDRFLSVFERVNQYQPLQARFTIDHAETITPRNIERIAALGGGIATQHRMAFQGEYFVDRYGAEAARETPPIRRMMEAGVPVGAGTDATRVASYDPWVSLYWLATGRTVGGMPLYGEDNVLSREDALRLWTHGSAWFSGEETVKGTLAPGMYADLAILSADYLSVPPDEIRAITSVLTMVDGRVVHADGDYADLAPPLPAAMPDWSPARHVPSPGKRPHLALERACHDGCTNACGMHGHRHIAWTIPIPVADLKSFWGALGCSCFAV